MSTKNEKANKNFEVRFLKHSGVLVETEVYQFFFDVISDVSEFVLPNKKQIFLISHGHHDHFDLNLSKYQGENCRYIVSDDITKEQVSAFGSGVYFVKPDESLQMDDIMIQTFESTDLGVSFMIQSPKCNIFHSGDLNWWHWENTPKSTQVEEEKAYKSIIDFVMERPIDIAFIPMDPRLGSATTWAIKYFLENCRALNVVPIHFGDQYEVIKNLSESLSNLTESMSGTPQLIIPTKDNDLIL